MSRLLNPLSSALSGVPSTELELYFCNVALEDRPLALGEFWSDSRLVRVKPGQKSNFKTSSLTKCPLVDPNHTLVHAQ